LAFSQARQCQAEKLAKNKAKRKKMPENCVKYVKEKSESKKLAEEYINLIESMGN